MKRVLWVALVFAGCSKKPSQPELHVFNWSEYFAPDTISNFEKEFHCRVVVDYIASPEMLRTKLESVPSGYDVVFPSEDLLPTLIVGEKLERLDPNQLPNGKNIASRFRGFPADPKNEFSVPYMWGTTGIAFNRKQFGPPPDSWAVLWDPKYTPKMTMLDDMREAFVAAMFANGDDPRKPTAEAIDRAKRKLLERKPLDYDSSPQMKLIVGDTWIAQAYNGDALQAAESEERRADLGFVIPKEGATIWIDNMCVAKGAKNRDLAHAFINYLLRPEVSAAISNFKKYANPNEAARPHILKEILGNPVIYPSESDLQRCFPLAELSGDLRKKMEEAWAEIRQK